MEKRNRNALIFCCIVIFSLIIGTIYTSYIDPTRRNRFFGVTYMTMNNPYYEVINNELLKVIEDNGDQLLVRDPALDVDKQIEQIYAFIEEDVDGIFINPIYSSGLSDVLQAVKDAGIPVIVIGAIAATWVSVTTSFQLLNSEGEAYLVLQDKLDEVYPSLLTAAFVMLCWYLLSKRKMSPIQVMLLLVVIAFIGVLIGFFDPGLVC